MIRSILVIIALIAIIWGTKYINRQPSANKKRLWIQVAIYSTAVLFIALALTGRIHWLGAAFAALLPFLRLMLSYAPKLFPFIQPWLAQKASEKYQQAKSANTSILHFVVSDSGEMGGTVIQGPLAEKKLSELTDGELLELLQFCQIDQDSQQLVRAYINKYHPHLLHSKKPSSGGMSLNEALEVLALNSPYTKQDVIDAHRKLMQKFHPDRGGSDYLAAKINAAKSVLLNNLGSD